MPHFPRLAHDIFDLIYTLFPHSPIFVALPLLCFLLPRLQSLLTPILISAGNNANHGDVILENPVSIGHTINTPADNSIKTTSEDTYGSDNSDQGDPDRYRNPSSKITDSRRLVFFLQIILQQLNRILHSLSQWLPLNGLFDLTVIQTPLRIITNTINRVNSLLYPSTRPLHTSSHCLRINPMNSLLYTRTRPLHTSSQGLRINSIIINPLASFTNRLRVYLSTFNPQHPTNLSLNPANFVNRYTRFTNNLISIVRNIINNIL